MHWTYFYHIISVGRSIENSAQSGLGLLEGPPGVVQAWDNVYHLPCLFGNNYSVVYGTLFGRGICGRAAGAVVQKI